MASHWLDSKLPVGGRHIFEGVHGWRKCEVISERGLGGGGKKGRGKNDEGCRKTRGKER
jgi:hypothetical protein